MQPIVNRAATNGVLTQIERLAGEKHRLLHRREPSAEEERRLAALQLELDQCWSLLRQRRSRRELGYPCPHAYPMLAAAEIARMRPFARARRFRRGERVLHAGKVSPGIYVVLSGAIHIIDRDSGGREFAVIEHGRGSFSGGRQLACRR